MKKTLLVSMVIGIVIGVSAVTAYAHRTEPEDDGSLLTSEMVDACNEIGESYNICPELLMAIVEEESFGDAHKVDGDEVGLMQVDVSEQADRIAELGVENIFDVYSNILVGSDYLHELFVEYEDPGIVLMVYSEGPEAAESIELSEYASDILTRSEYLERAHGK